ncbi:MAG: hypothetical protein U1E04_17145 [Hylemonella sp.]|nr:hypothetical protein [Hylemonella sp.]
MLLIFLEALAALLLLVLIVWWTMFSGRKKGELAPPEQGGEAPTRPPAREPERPD